jgi:hypothetical protein
MKMPYLEIYLQPFLNSADEKEAQESDEVELGFDTMLSHDVIEFLRTDCKPLVQRVRNKQNAVFGLDEYELAMV